MKKSSLQVVLARGHLVPVKDMSAASCAVQAYIAFGGMGATQWYGEGGRDVGMVVKDGKPVAHVSYNGRVWKGANIGAVGQPEIKVKPCKRSRS